MEAKFKILQRVWTVLTEQSEVQIHSFEVHNINVDDAKTSILYSGPESDRKSQDIPQDYLGSSPKEACEIAKRMEFQNREDMVNQSADRIANINELLSRFES